MEKTALVILAAGLGKRMKSDLPKVAIRTREKALIQHVLENAAGLKPEKTVVVVGHKREIVEKAVSEGAEKGWYAANNFSFALQAEQRGTGDAVRAALPDLKDFSGTVLVLCGDAPLLRAETLQRLLETHQQQKATLTLLSFHETKPNSYGRVIRDAQQAVAKIVETKDATPAELAVSECNASIYAVDSSFLAPAINQLKNDNKQGEYYFTDVVAQAAKEGQTVAALSVGDPSETYGVNTPLDLNDVNACLNRRRIEALLLSGVDFVDRHCVYIDAEATVAPGAVIGPQVTLTGKTVIETGVIIEGSAYLKDVVVKSGARIKFGVRAESAEIGAQAAVGPFANLREGSVLGEASKVGNFVETKKAKIGARAKAPHLTYLGDCEVGENANIGAGTITCNYDGFNKHKTVIGKDAFIGSNSSLVAPVTIGCGASVGAGSVIAKTSVPDNALAVSRAELKVKEGWAAAFRAKHKK